jgi:alpha-L-fucosidase 2
VKNLSQFILIFILFIQFSCQNSSNNAVESTQTLWYDKPAVKWEEALPLGNGRLGVMVFGKTSTERIQLNDDSLWPAETGWGITDGTREDVEQVRKYLFEGKITEADQMMVDKFSRKGITRSHQTLGELFIELNHENITEYRRELDLNKAISTVSYKTNGQPVSEKVFVSKPHQAIIIEIKTTAEEGLSGKIKLNRPLDEGHPTATVSINTDGLLKMQGMVTQRGGKFNSEATPILEGVKFETCLRIKNSEGEVIQGDDYLELKNVKNATFYLVSNSSYYHEDYQNQNKKDLVSLSGISLEDIENEHIKDHQNLFSRVQLSLGENSLDSIPTDKRLTRMKNDSIDLGMEALLFQYGRYLLIGSSRLGTNPANLQGLWNQHIAAPWNADYHLNINLQMNYWPANMTDLDELNMPLFDYIDRVVETGKETAQSNFGCEGTFFPHATDLWASPWMRGATAYWGSSMGAGGWMMQHYWQHFAYTQDTTFLKERALPAMLEVAKFYSDWIIKDVRDGKLISAPSTSPENRYFTEDGKKVALCLGSAMDQQVITEVFDNYIEASAILGINNSFLEKVKKQRQQLRPGFVLGSDGRILEWDREYMESEPGHRHMSHLYGFHPGVQVSKDKTPEIFAAVRKTLDYRLDHGGAGTGWSRAWLINCSARLLDGDMAHEHIQLLFKKSMYDNLFDGHPPFQIDGNFGFTSGLTEMLLQSHLRDDEGDYILDILPALPSVYKKGNVSGLKGRGAFEVSIEWKDGELTAVEVLSLNGNNLNVQYKGKTLSMETSKNQKTILSSTEFQ